MVVTLGQDDVFRRRPQTWLPWGADATPFSVSGCGVCSVVGSGVNRPTSQNPESLRNNKWEGHPATGSPVWSSLPQHRAEGGPFAAPRAARPGRATVPPGGSGAPVSVQA